MNSTPSIQDPSNRSPNSPASTDATYLMPASPLRDAKSRDENYRPRIVSTVGQRPACLVSASVTYVGNNEIYAFGGFDQYTDEVYNHVLRLSLETRQWSLVDNYGDIPGVRMGHTATLWKDGKVLIFGGENEHRAYLSDLIIFDLNSAHWTQPELRGAAPQGRARHSAVIHDDKLFIIGGLSGRDNSTILDDFCFLDLKKWEWSRTWRFVPRFGHTSWVWEGRIWVFGGLTEGMECANDIWWLDARQSPCFETSWSFGSMERQSPAPRLARPQSAAHPTIQSSGNTGYAANSSSIQTGQSAPFGLRRPLMAPGSISSLNFVSGPHIPSQSYGTHFHAFSSGCLLDFVTPGPTGTSSLDTSLCALELETMRWERLADGKDLFHPNYRWHYCCLNQEGTHAWLLGTPDQPLNGLAGGGEYLSDVLPIDLRKLGLLGNSLATDSRTQVPSSDTHMASHLTGIGADLAKMFDKPPETGGSADFIVTAECSEGTPTPDGAEFKTMESKSTTTSPPIHVHRLILESRWPHFARMIAAQMSEFHSKKLHIPEPYSVVRAFLYYLYTDCISPDPEDGSPNLSDVAGMLVMSNCYDMPRLRLLCRNRLGRELDVDHAAVIWERAGVANEEWLRKRAARFSLTFWGRVVRTTGFLALKHSSMAELCQEIDSEGRVVGADELEFVGGLAGARFGGGFAPKESRSHRSSSVGTALGEDMEELDEEEGMELS